MRNPILFFLVVYLIALCAAFIIGHPVHAAGWGNCAQATCEKGHV